MKTLSMLVLFIFHISVCFLFLFVDSLLLLPSYHSQFMQYSAAHLCSGAITKLINSKQLSEQLWPTTSQATAISYSNQTLIRINSVYKSDWATRAFLTSHKRLSTNTFTRIKICTHSVSLLASHLHTTNISSDLGFWVDHHTKSPFMWRSLGKPPNHTLWKSRLSNRHITQPKCISVCCLLRRLRTLICVLTRHIAIL